MLILDSVSTAKTEVTVGFQELLKWGFLTYRDFLFGIVVGMFLAWIYHYFLGHRNLKLSYQELIKAKEETIVAYKTLIYERLDKVEVDEKNSAFYKKVKNFFKKSNI